MIDGHYPRSGHRRVVLGVTHTEVGEEREKRPLHARQGALDGAFPQVDVGQPYMRRMIELSGFNLERLESTAKSIVFRQYV